MFKKVTKLFILSTLVFLLLALVACGTEGEDEVNGDQSSGDQPEESAQENGSDNSEKSSEEMELNGSVVIDGSGTVYPLMARLAEEYMINEEPNVSVEVGRSGTSAGFEKFLTENGTDFNDASREIKDEEIETAEELGIDVKEMKVALDGLTIVIHPENDWATEMTEEEIIQTFLADGGIETWSDINDEWPNEEVNTYGPNENHGTYEFFYEEILDEQDLAEGTNLQQEYATLVTLVSEDINSIGFFGFGYYDNNQDQVQAVNIDFGDGPVGPSLETIDEEGAYQNFTRPVFTYLNVDRAKENPQVLDFASYVANSINTFAGEVGFAPIPDEEAQQLADELEELR
ncbi:PstS family phosphate ABC transporter substrate-binding protein [Alkalibacillus aidingensis]|uniref:PstS family phosphate ABC transporter substrate-binding protein n=1 Tax=Alkalibacillus aidingensis TaxID=2747607 RepID=UPI0016611626|nr:PstS family phosphate ABC transporter substrate-binding protein [Alkalibacillus aidingensis]